MTRSTLRGQRGSALVPAMLVMMMLLMSGAAVLATVNTQQHEGRRERVRESTFQLAEGVLNTQIYRLSKRWPGENVSTSGRYPVSCPSPTNPGDCPDQVTLKRIFDNVDHGDWATVQWSTHVRDDDDGASPANTNFYSDAVLPGNKTWDANGNNKVWVRAQATVRGRTRVLVALVKAEVVASKLVPNETVVAGWFQTTNQGSGQAKDFIVQDAGGSVIVRCPTGTDPSTPVPANLDGDCADYKRDQLGSTISPERVYSRPAYGNAYEDPEAGIDALREQAIAQGNYVASGCPTSLAGVGPTGVQEPGEIVFLENTGVLGCDFQSNSVFNTPTLPGAVVIARGGPLQLSGTMQFYGLIYHANLEETVDGTRTQKAALLQMNGTAKVEGGLIVDGVLGGVEVGSSGQGQLRHNPNAGGALKTFGTAGIVQNSFRELRSPATTVAN